jgi:hypothetical protein
LVTTIASTDKGFRGITQVENTQIDPSLKGEQAKQIPKNTKEKSRHKQEVIRKRFIARATISYLKRNKL